MTTDALQLSLPLRRYKRHVTHRTHGNSREVYHKSAGDLSARAALVLAWVRMHGPCTDRQVKEGLKYSDMNSVRPRCTELIDRGMLCEVGTTRDHVTGKTVRLLAVEGGK
jgi:hypothetical protein